MAPNLEKFISEALSQSSAAIKYMVSQRLAELFPGKAIIETEHYLFDLNEFAKAKLCELELKPGLYHQFESYWSGPEDFRIKEHPRQVWFRVNWQNFGIEVLVLHLGCDAHYWIIADIKEIAENFFRAVCEANTEIEDEVLVFEGGYWHKDEELFKAIKSATFDNLILSGNLKQALHADLAQFFAARATYAEYGAPWKRGILLVGPPGNGKTHAVKALVNSLGKPCLYVKSFNSRNDTEEGNIRDIYERARKVAPCIVVLEDLDSLITPQNRSFFLNELDGFAMNSGILTLATTNHPEKLDPAIVNRPSRFDRKYHFDLPEKKARLAYLCHWNQGLKPALQLPEEATVQVAELTEGFSFAYLKELFLSSVMGWIANSQPGTMAQVMVEQTTLLQEQMVNLNTQPETKDED